MTDGRPGTAGGDPPPKVPGRRLVGESAPDRIPPRPDGSGEGKQHFPQSRFEFHAGLTPRRRLTTRLIGRTTGRPNRLPRAGRTRV